MRNVITKLCTCSLSQHVHSCFISQGTSTTFFFCNIFPFSFWTRESTHKSIRCVHLGRKVQHYNLDTHGTAKETKINYDEFETVVRVWPEEPYHFISIYK